MIEPRERGRYRMVSQLPLVESDVVLGRFTAAYARLATMTDSLGTMDRWTRQVMEYEIGISAANTLLAEGHPDSAIMRARSLRLAPNPPLYSPNLGFLNLAAIYPHRHDVIARACLAKGDTLGAMHELDGLMRVFPERPDFRFVPPLLHFELAVLLDQIGEADKARQHFEKFVTICGKSERDIAQLQRARQRLRELAAGTSHTRDP